MTYKISKSVRPGTVCELRGDKICRAGRRTRRVLGVWVNGSPYTVLDASTGHVIRMQLPEGVCLQGTCTARVAQ